LWPEERGNPFDVVDRPRTFPYRRPRPLTPDEVRAILAAINTDCLTGRRDYALRVTILNTGRRAPEVLNLKWGDIQPSEEGGYFFRYRARGQVQRAELPAACYQAMCAYLELDDRPPERMGPDDYVFVAMNPALVKRLPRYADKPVQPNRPLSGCFANRILKKYARLVGVDPRRAHVHHLRRVGAELEW
jgi:integrase